MEEDQEFYLEQLMENYKNPRNYGELDNYTFFKRYKNPSCGDTFQIYVKLNEKEEIEDVKFNGEGCAISTASMSYLTQKIKGMNFEEAKQLTDKDIYEMIGVKVSPARVNCALLSLRAFKEGAQEYETQES